MTRALRVVHLTTTAVRIGGAERLLIDIARRVPRGLWDLSFVILDSNGEVGRQLEACGWPTQYIPMRTWAQVPGGLVRLRRSLRDLRPDILHTHLFHASAIGAMIAPVSSASLVHTRHYSDYMKRFGSAPRRLIDRWVASRCDAIAAVSDAARDFLVDEESIPAKRVVVIENGVDVEGLGAVSRDAGRRALAEIGLGAGPIIACSASFRAQKGHLVLFEAMRTLVARWPTLRLLLLGTGPDEGTLRAKAQSLGVGNHVFFAGYRSDALTLVCGADLYVQPSLEEGFGLALVEAMAMGLPVVASNVGGMSKTVVDRKSGLLVPAGDASALASAVHQLLQEQDLALALGAAAQTRARADYSVARMIADYDRLYRQVCKV